MTDTSIAEKVAKEYARELRKWALINKKSVDGFVIGVTPFIQSAIDEAQAKDKERIEELESIIDQIDLADGEIQLAGCPECERKDNRIEALKRALREIQKGEGPYSMDHQTHASNTIEAMRGLATDALKGE